jgi:hypothetical protein
MGSYPSCLDDRLYAVDFYIAHPSDFRYNAINQRFWLQYHSKTDLSGPCSSSSTHLICPSDTSKAYAKCHKLLQFHRFLNLTHTDTYIHGPFDVATVNGRKIRKVGTGYVNLAGISFDPRPTCFTAHFHLLQFNPTRFMWITAPTQHFTIALFVRRLLPPTA